MNATQIINLVTLVLQSVVVSFLMVVKCHLVKLSFFFPPPLVPLLLLLLRHIVLVLNPLVKKEKNIRFSSSKTRLNDYE